MSMVVVSIIIQMYMSCSDCVFITTAKVNCFHSMCARAPLSGYCKYNRFVIEQKSLLFLMMNRIFH